jgi:hypothetical protein
LNGCVVPGFIFKKYLFKLKKWSRNTRITLVADVDDAGCHIISEKIEWLNSLRGRVCVILIKGGG